MRHPKNLIQQIIRLRRNNATLGEIVTKTDLSKTTIYHHIRKIPKSKALLLKIGNIARVVQKKVADQRRGKSIKKYTFKRPLGWTPEHVSLIAHLMFDGEISRLRCTYNNRSNALIEKVRKNMEIVYGVKDHKKYISREEVIRICYFNVELAAFIKNKALELEKKILVMPTSRKLAFLKSFFDDEGSVYFRKNHRRVRGYQHSYDRLCIVRDLLSNIGISSKIDKKYNEIIISRKDDIFMFASVIGFSKGVSVNGKRTNSIWKESLEKNEILRRLLKSYRKNINYTSEIDTESHFHDLPSGRGQT